MLPLPAGPRGRIIRCGGRRGEKKVSARGIFTGHPALAMMAGISSSGLPLSVQFVGRNFAEATLFQIAREWERAAGSDKTHPPIE